MWDQLSPTPTHVAYLTISIFLIIYALFSQFIRNELHLSEPPLAVLYGVLLGPVVLGILNPVTWGVKDEDDIVLQEITRVILGIQCFFVGIELPKYYFKRHYVSVLYFLGPIMTFSWAITALFAYLIFHTSIASALIIGACLAPTDPVLAASVLSRSKFSSRVPKRLKNLLSAESACNDGISFPFLYIGITLLKYSSVPTTALKEWLLITILWQCVLGLFIGLVLGKLSNRLLRFSYLNEYITKPSFVVFYLLLSILCVGTGSVLGSDDFLVAFGAGVGFAHDGWFAKKTKEVPFPQILDMMLNSALFVFFGALIPWAKFVPREITPNIGVWQLILFITLVLLFRRIPIVLAMKRLIPDITTYREALFCGHFGPMGVGALFLAMEAKSELLKDGDNKIPTPISLSLTDPIPPTSIAINPYTSPDHLKAIHMVWPTVCFAVLGSIFIHGLSTAAISFVSHYAKRKDDRAPLLGQESDALEGMNHEAGGGDSEPEASGSEDGF